MQKSVDVRALPLEKKRFDINRVLARIRAEVEQFADAAMFDLRSHGYSTIFQQLVACIISIRTYDEVSLPVSITLLKRAPTPEKMAKLTERQIDALISKSTFHDRSLIDNRRVVVRRLTGRIGRMSRIGRIRR